MSAKSKRKCCVTTCRQPLSRGAFEVPKDPSVREHWLVGLGLVEVNESAKICFRHFAEGDLIFTEKAS